MRGGYGCRLYPTGPGDARRARADFPQRASTGLVRRYDLLVVEELAVTGPRRNRRYAKRPPDTGRSAFRSMLDDTAVDRFRPSSRTCSHRGHLSADTAGCRTYPSRRPCTTGL